MGQYCFARNFPGVRFWLLLPGSQSALLRWKPVRPPTAGVASLRSWGMKVRLVPPVYVKPFLKRQKNDVADAEVIIEEALRPTMRFVAVETETQ